jgi:plastocyanin
VPGRYLFLCVAVAILAGIASVPACSETIQITIDKLEFSPKEIKAKVGDTVEWINKDFLAHTATVRGDWDVLISANKSADLILRRTGTVEYYCRFHPNMKGRISITPE